MEVHTLLRPRQTATFEDAIVGLRGNYGIARGGEQLLRHI